MSFFVAARKDTKVLLEAGTRSPDLAGAILTGFRAALCTNHGILDANLFVYVIPETDADAKAVMDGAEWSAAWTGSDITGIDLSVETAKRILKVSASKNTILADDTDTTVITVELWKADNSGIATSVTTSADMPISTPNGIKKVRVALVNGVASRVFKTAIAGEWRIPATSKRFSVVRVGQVATIESVGSFSDL